MDFIVITLILAVAFIIIAWLHRPTDRVTPLDLSSLEVKLNRRILDEIAEVNRQLNQIVEDVSAAIKHGDASALADRVTSLEAEVSKLTLLNLRKK